MGVGYNASGWNKVASQGVVSGTTTKANAASTGTASTDYMSTLAAAVESLKPGGTTYQSLAAELNKDAQLYGNKLNASAISSGLGNAALGNSTKVFKELASAKTQLQSSMMTQYISALQNLASLSSQQEQAAAASKTPTMASQGYSAAGTKLTDFGFGSDPMASSFSSGKKKVSSSSLPSLYSSAGTVGSSNDTYTSLTSPLFG
jgi:hypothetical protein